MKSKNILFTFLLLICSLIVNTVPNKAEEIGIFAKAAIAADVDSGAIYVAKNIDDQVGLASISKFFVVNYFLLHMEEKNLNLDSEITISENVATIKNRYKDASGIYLPEGSQVSVRKLIELALVFSDNGATIQLAEALCGSEQAFVSEINNYFQQQNCSNTNFINVSGLDENINGQVKGNMSTPREVMRLTVGVLESTPDITDYTDMEAVEFDGESYPSWDEMLPGGDVEYPGVKGLKTGSSEVSGYSYLCYCEQNGKRTISLVANATTSSGVSSSISRFQETERILNYTEKQQLVPILNKDTKIQVDIKNNGLGDDYLTPKYNISVVKGNDTNLSFANVSYNQQYFDGEAIKDYLPINTSVAKLSVKLADSSKNASIYYTDGLLEVDLVAPTEIKKENIFEKILYAIPRFFMNAFNKI